jgi:iron(III) transport system permease protein
MAVTVVVALVVLGLAPLFAALVVVVDAPASVWAALFTPRIGSLLVSTVMLGVTTAACSALIGVPIARCIARRRGALSTLVAMLLPLPLIVPPWIAALAWAKWVRLSGFWGAVALLTATLWPLVALFALRGFRSAGRAGDAARLARGRWAAWRSVELPLAMPSICSGMLLVFVFSITDFGVVDFLSFNAAEPFTVLSSEIFQKWARLDSAPAAVVVSMPAILLGLLALGLMLVSERRASGRFTGPVAGRGAAERGTLFGTLGLLAVCALILAPLFELTRWAATNPDPLGTAAASRDEMLRSVGAGLGTGLIVALLGVACARVSLSGSPRRQFLVLALALLPLAAPGVLFAVGEIRLWHHPANPFSEVIYRSPLLLVLATAGRFLPLGVLAARALLMRQDRGPAQAARLTGRSPWQRWLAVDLPLLAPATGLAFTLGYLLSLRELDIATLIPAGNATLIHKIFSFVHFVSDDMIAVLSLSLVLLVVLPLLAARLLGVPGVESGPGRDLHSGRG